MADRHMDFDAARADSEEAEVDPLYFTLCGTKWNIRSDVPGAMLLDFITADKVTTQLGAGKALLIEAIEEEQRPAFEVMIRRGKPATVLLTGDINTLTAAALRAKAKELGVEVPAKAGKDKLISSLVGKKDNDGISPPSMPQFDEIIAWLVRELVGRPSTQS